MDQMLNVINIWVTFAVQFVSQLTLAANGEAVQLVKMEMLDAFQWRKLEKKAQCRGLWAWSPLWLTEPAKVKNFTDEPPSSEKRWEMQLFGIEWTQSY